MKFLKSLLVAVAFIATSAGANAADVQTFGVIGAGTYDYENSYVAGAGEFEDYVTFTLTDSFIGSFGAGALNFTVGNNKRLYIDDFTQILFNETTNQVVATGADFTVNSLTAGDYRIIITGAIQGSRGGEYAGAFTITPVPEPSSAAMLLIGFAALGAVARRRKTL